MIRRELKSQLIELEKRFIAAIKAKNIEIRVAAISAALHAKEVAAVVLYGGSKIDEPLLLATLRTRWKLKEEFANNSEPARGNSYPSFYPTLMFNALPGADDNLKFERIFSKAPTWLLKFTAIEWDAKILGFRLRKLDGTPELGREARLDRNQ
jgi:hypothetical protein